MRERRPLGSAALLVAVAACWSAPHPPGLGALPGLVWITERQPYRAPGPVWDLVVDGNSAVVTGADGRLARIDLATGRVVREKRIGDIDIHKLVRLDPARWLAVGRWHDDFVAVIVDDATFAATRLDLHARREPESHTVGAVKLPDGTIAISGPGLALTAFDPKTWQRVREIDPEHGVFHLRVDGNRLLGIGKEAAAFDLTTGVRTKLAFRADSHGERVVAHQYSNDTFEVRDADKVIFSVHGDVFDDARFDPSGDRLVLISEGTLHLFALPGGSEIRRIDLGWRSRSSAKMVFDGKRLVIAAGSLVQAIDLETGTATPAGQPPIDTTTQLIARDDGTLLAIERAAWRFANGKLISTADAHDHGELTSPRGETGTYGSYGDGRKPLVAVRSLDNGQVVHRWKAKEQILDGWLGAAGQVVVEDNDVPQHILRSQGEELVPVVTLPSSSLVSDVDADSGGALITAHGEVGRVRLVDGSHDDHVMRLPRCEEYGRAKLEPSGDRAITYTDGDIVAWQRGKDDPIGSAHFGDDVGDVTFLPGGGDLVFDVGESLVMWTPATGELRTLALGARAIAAVSPDGKRLGLVLGDGRVALVDLTTLRAAMKRSTAAPVVVPKECPGNDLFRVPSDERPIPDADAGGDE
jgi:hypothetical protein